jgi:hypothetical protein
MLVSFVSLTNSIVNLQLLLQLLCDCWMLSYYRWATQGFDFLQAIEPAFISALPEDDFLVWHTLSAFSVREEPSWSVTLSPG